jgi:hypothetical protein
MLTSANNDDVDVFSGRRRAGPTSAAGTSAAAEAQARKKAARQEAGGKVRKEARKAAVGEAGAYTRSLYSQRKRVYGQSDMI